jgi:2-polyprenyl-3-methyl-5-hydroxy-6-metoxy-1,4-benzoquinol methylase
MKNKSIKLGDITSQDFVSDPKRLGITLSRYKFVGKMFEGFNSVLEVGAGDGFKSLSLKNSVNYLKLSDIDLKKKNLFDSAYSFKNIDYIVHDFVKKPLKEKFDGIFALDVLEHIKKKQENRFIQNLKKSLKINGTLIIGMPSLQSQKYASKLAKKEHVNCKTKKELRKFLKRYFKNVYMFSMNDEVLHTGFDDLSHYIIGLSN